MRSKFMMRILACAGFGCATITLPSTAYAQAFSCNNDMLQVQSGQLRKFDPATSAYVNIGAQQNAYNAIGYNRADNFLYGIRNTAGANNLIRVASDGSTTNIGTISERTVSADIDDDNNYIALSNVAGHIIIYDLIDNTESIITFTGGNAKANDVIFIRQGGQGYLIGAQKGTVEIINLDTQTATIKTTSGLPNNSFGAIWIDNNDRILTFDNKTGLVYELLNVFSASPSAMLIATGVPSNNNDGSFCPLQSFPNFAPLAMDDAFTIPAGSYSDNVLTNNGNGIDQDPDGDPISVSTALISNPSNGAASIDSMGNFTYTPDIGFSGSDSFTYEISDPDGLTDTAIVTLTVTLNADFSITKTNTAGVNGDIDQSDDIVLFGTSTTYSLVITNNGPDAVSGAVVTDVITSGLTCAAGDAVTITGDGVPAGAFTIGQLTGAGITLGTLADGEATTITFNCIIT